MTYRPRSSVTTILANLVGRSVVSAITQTPASGPVLPVTTPPRSVAPTVTAALLGCAVAAHGASVAAAIRHDAEAATVKLFIIFEAIADARLPVSTSV